MVSGNFPTQLSLITACHSPGTGAFSLAQRPPRNRMGLLGTQGDRDFGDQPVFDNFWTQQVLTSPSSGPTSGHRLPSVADALLWVEWLLLSRWPTVFTSHANSNLLEAAARSFVLIILKFYPALGEKISRLSVDVCRAEGKGKLRCLR